MVPEEVVPSTPNRADHKLAPTPAPSDDGGGLGMEMEDCWVLTKRRAARTVAAAWQEGRREPACKSGIPRISCLSGRESPWTTGPQLLETAMVSASEAASSTQSGFHC